MISTLIKSESKKVIDFFSEDIFNSNLFDCALLFEQAKANIKNINKKQVRFNFINKLVRHNAQLTVVRPPANKIINLVKSAEAHNVVIDHCVMQEAENHFGA